MSRGSGAPPLRSRAPTDEKPVPSSLALTLHPVGANADDVTQCSSSVAVVEGKEATDGDPGEELVDDGGPRAACHAVRDRDPGMSACLAVDRCRALWWLRDTGRPLGDRGGGPRGAAGADARGVAD